MQKNKHVRVPANSCKFKSKAWKLLSARHCPTEAEPLNDTYKSWKASSERSAVNTSSRPITCGTETHITPAGTSHKGLSAAGPLNFALVTRLTFSCFMCLRSLSSLQARLAKSSDWKGRYSFLMATLTPDLESWAELRAEETHVRVCELRSGNSSEAF